MEEILALEEDLEAARASAAEAGRELQSKLERAEAEATAALERAERLARERASAETPLTTILRFHEFTSSASVEERLVPSSSEA